VARDREHVSHLLQVVVPAKAPTIVKRARGLIAWVMDEAVKSGRINGHKLAGIEVPDPGRTHKPFVLATQAQIETIAKMPNGLLIYLMHGLGLRVSETLAANVSNFREGYTVYRVTEQVTPDGADTAPLRYAAVSDGVERHAARLV
jgi:integrase